MVRNKRSACRVVDADSWSAGPPVTTMGPSGNAAEVRYLGTFVAQHLRGAISGRLVGVEVAGPLHYPPVGVGQSTGGTGEELVVGAR